MRHNGPYSGEGGLGKLTTKQDFAKTAQSHDISIEELKRACDPWDHDTWKPAKVSSARTSRGAPSDTSPVEAYSPTGKYAKKGGSGQRSGS